MTERSREQDNLIRAARHVQEIADAYPLQNEDDPAITPDECKRRAAHNVTPRKKQKSYGSLCHSFPVLVRRSGLIQAAGFLQAKGAGEGPSREAYQLLLPHVADVVGKPKAGNDLARQLADLPVMDLMIVTQRLLDAWIHYKHFAESILDVASAREGETE